MKSHSCEKLPSSSCTPRRIPYCLGPTQRQVRYQPRGDGFCYQLAGRSPVLTSGSPTRRYDKSGTDTGRCCYQLAKTFRSHAAVAREMANSVRADAAKEGDGGEEDGYERTRCHPLRL
eukprot:3912089-Rhodomonas_salina.3